LGAGGGVGGGIGVVGDDSVMIGVLAIGKKKQIAVDVMARASWGAAVLRPYTECVLRLDTECVLCPCSECTLRRDTVCGDAGSGGRA